MSLRQNRRNHVTDSELRLMPSDWAEPQSQQPARATMNVATQQCKITSRRRTLATGIAVITTMIAPPAMAKAASTGASADAELVRLNAQHAAAIHAIEAIQHLPDETFEVAFLPFIDQRQIAIASATELTAMTQVGQRAKAALVLRDRHFFWPTGTSAADLTSLDRLALSLAADIARGDVA